MWWVKLQVSLLALKWGLVSIGLWAAWQGLFLAQLLAVAQSSLLHPLAPPHSRMGTWHPFLADNKGNTDWTQPGPDITHVASKWLPGHLQVGVITPCPSHPGEQGHGAPRKSNALIGAGPDRARCRDGEAHVVTSMREDQQGCLGAGRAPCARNPMFFGLRREETRDHGRSCQLP